MSKNLPIILIVVLILLGLSVSWLIWEGHISAPRTINKLILNREESLDVEPSGGTRTKIGRTQSTELNVLLSSKHPEYQIQLTDKQKILAYLDHIGFKTANPDILEIRMFLTTEPQNYKQEFDKQNNTPENPRYSIGYQNSGNDKLFIYVQLGKTIYSEKKLDLIATKVFLYALYLKSSLYQEKAKEGYSYNMFTDGWKEFNKDVDVAIIEVKVVVRK